MGGETGILAAMLERLIIRDLAVVERAEIPFGPGLVCVTGETGAGKSLVVQAIGLLVGGRGDADAVREGAASAVVEGEFRLAGPAADRVRELLRGWDVEAADDRLIVRREVQAEGRSRATVNHSPVTLAALKRLGEVLADLHGQHDHQSLLRPEAGALLLDRLAGLEPDRHAYALAVAAWRDAADARARLESTLAGHAERADFLGHAAREIDEARLVAGEEEALAVDAARLAHADRLRALVGAALERLSESEAAGTATLAAALHDLEAAARLDPSLDDQLPTLREARLLAEECARNLATYADRLQADPAALESIEARRDLIARLTRKYHRAVPELLAWRQEIAADLELGENRDRALEQARAAVDAAVRECRRGGQALSRARAAAARQWGPRLTRALRPLGLPHAAIDFAVAPRQPAEGFAALGLDEVTIVFTPNPGEAPRPLRSIASGGELSRVMLALKSAAEGQDSVDLLLFDEVDSGVGGAVGQAVGERLLGLARHRQVICITHLPMIAALASHHLVVEKRVSGGRTRASFEQVEDDARIAELARMLAGERATETTRRQARELLGARRTAATTTAGGRS